MGLTHVTVTLKATQKSKKKICVKCQVTGDVSHATCHSSHVTIYKNQFKRELT